MKAKFKYRKVAIAITAAAVATVAIAATQILLKPEITLSEGGNGHKPKLQRAGDGTLVMAYGDSPTGARNVYDTKGDVDRPARDIYVKWCKPDATKTCDLPTDWTKATTAAGPANGNVSNAALKSSMYSTWLYNEATDTLASDWYAGDTDKPNIKTNGPVMVLTWTGKYCPDSNLQDETSPTEAPLDASGIVGVKNLNQRAVRYLEREGRIVPFSCAWTATSKDSGKTWSAPIQLSNGERDAKSDASFGSYVSDAANPLYKTGQLNISWQEDPQGLQLGEGDGPGDGASGANVSNGTDVWYAHGKINLADTDTSNDVVFAKNAAAQANARAWRLTDNWDQTKNGIGGTDEANPVFSVGYDSVTGKQLQVDKDTIESGGAGAARPNIGMVGTNSIVAYEETKNSAGLASGKFIRYHSFRFDQPVNDPAVTTDDLTANNPVGCIISDPLKNARRVRFLTQSPLLAGPGGVNIAIFWKEGIYDTGGPSDIVVRRGMGGLAATKMVPAVSANCATSVWEEAEVLANAQGENISSRANRLAGTDNGLTDGTEADFYENALAHRGVLRGNDLWIGYNYTPDLVAMWNQDTNYNFWLRKFTFDSSTGGSWALPSNVSNMTDVNINVREPRIFGTPPSSATACPSGNPADPTTTDATQCQNTNVIYVLWGSQANVNPFDPAGGDDLGVYGTVSVDGAQSFLPQVRISEEMGSMFDDDESAFETQPVTRPDGTRFYVVFNTENATAGTAAANYRSGDITQVADTLPTVELRIDTDGNQVPDLLVAFTYDAATDTISESSGSLAGFPRQGNKLDLTGTTVLYEGVVTDTFVYEFAALVSDVSTTPVDSGGGGCAAATGDVPFDPMLLMLAALGALGVGVRRVRRS